MKKTLKFSRILNDKTTPLLFTKWRAGEFLTISSGGVGMESLNYRVFAYHHGTNTLGMAN